MITPGYMKIHNNPKVIRGTHTDIAYFISPSLQEKSGLKDHEDERSPM
jgi:hypothetical protein